MKLQIRDNHCTTYCLANINIQNLQHSSQNISQIISDTQEQLKQQGVGALVFNGNVCPSKELGGLSFRAMFVHLSDIAPLYLPSYTTLLLSSQLCSSDPKKIRRRQFDEFFL